MPKKKPFWQGCAIVVVPSILSMRGGYGTHNLAERYRYIPVMMKILSRADLAEEHSIPAGNPNVK